MNSQLGSTSNSNQNAIAKPIATTNHPSSQHLRQQASSSPIYSPSQQPLHHHHNEYMGPSKPSLHFVGGYHQRFPAYMDCKEGWRLNDPKTKHPHSTTHNCSIKDHIIIHGNDFESCKCYMKLRDNEEGKTVSESFFSYDHHNHRYFVEFPVVSKINNMKGNTSSRVVYIDIYDSKNKLICVSDAFWVRSRSRSQMMLDLAKRKREQTTSSPQQLAGPTSHRTFSTTSTTSTTPYTISTTSPGSTTSTTLEEEDRDSMTSAEKQQLGSAMMMVDFSNSGGAAATTTSTTPASTLYPMGSTPLLHGQSTPMINASSYPFAPGTNYLSSPSPSSSQTIDPLSSLATVATSMAGAAPLTPSSTSHKQVLPSIDALTLGSDDDGGSSTTNPLVEDHSSSAIQLPHIDSFIKKRKFEDRYRLQDMYSQLERNKEDISRLSRMLEDQNKVIQELSMKISNMEAQSKKPKFN
ncbi:hypothetical protein C9374_009293 [Naegleria lovaniensis]|uniref:Uncharacterized protein n=1 Tax=Naegleria lovaniensis TaxID=51637 RepID=A0AA88KEB8_NAELO|nr:uncharacterized protein C9374_009293 [Naegleria lovaniensis]KAG2377382.1 hypothetical protein C9374_009293 [Naegleria lovaniensis]